MRYKRPSRYINGEVNAIHKQAPVRVALAFPDVYEVGMSHLGLKILYDIINRISFASAERVFSPWLDMGAAMKHYGEHLVSLESRTPLRDFDIVGFSLQYELAYTTVLDMLDLGGIPVRWEKRMERTDLPIILAGGPCTLNPSPMAAFIDAFLIGDGEDAIQDILETYHQWKVGGSSDKISLLRALSRIEGIFVPSLGKDKQIRRRNISSLEDAPFPDKPVVPFANIVHDRINIEIARGCSMGCRFCQAGMAYRPVRERSPSRVLDLAEKSLASTGYEEISFTSLSAGDYSCLLELLNRFNRRFRGKKVAISLPSLRVASLNRGILREIKEVRKTGFTIAPEAGTDRLRAVINKDFSEDTYMRALETLFQEGWQNLKLYYMTGLPTETAADIEAIPKMVFNAVRTSRKLTGRHVNVSVGVSSFIPKPHTPFQWCGQNDILVLKEKNNYLKKAFLRKGIKFKGHSEEMSLLEAVFARGDERLADLIEHAWRLGCKLDAWTESFDFEKWKSAMDFLSIDAHEYATKERSHESYMPWESIDTGVTKEFLWKEYQNAILEKITPDCRKHCRVCGLDCVTGTAREVDEAAEPRAGTLLREHISSVFPSPDKEPPEFPGANTSQVSAADTLSVRVRMGYSKTGSARFLSHLELVTALMRAMRRAGFPLRYSAGFHPSPKVSFGPALGVGVAGLREYLDMEFLPPFELEECLANLNLTLPDGIHANSMRTLNGREKSLNSSLIRYRYEIRHGNETAVERFLLEQKVLVNRKDNLINLKEMVDELKKVGVDTFQLAVRDLDDLKARLDELLPAIFGIPVEDLDITRISMAGSAETCESEAGDESVWAAKS